MSTTRAEIEDRITQLLQTTARQYAGALAEYGDSFAAYGRGEIGAADLAQRNLSVAVRESRQVGTTVIGLGIDYAKWAASLIGIRELPQQNQETESHATTSRATTSRAKAR